MILLFMVALIWVLIVCICIIITWLLEAFAIANLIFEAFDVPEEVIQLEVIILYDIRRPC